MSDRRFSFLFYLPWAILFAAAPVFAYWWWEPTPLTIEYTSPLFSREPVRTRDAAQYAAVSQIAGGSTVYRYIEYCVHKPFSGRIQRAWVGSAIVWPAPDTTTTVSTAVGCTSNSFAVEVPTSSPSRTFSYRQTMHIGVNPIRTDTIEYPPIALRILSPQDVAKGMQ
jgi:hypothetical protein